jgi:hypothetical protein
VAWGLPATPPPPLPRRATDARRGLVNRRIVPPARPFTCGRSTFTSYRHPGGGIVALTMDINPRRLRAERSPDIEGEKRREKGRKRAGLDDARGRFSRVRLIGGGYRRACPPWSGLGFVWVVGALVSRVWCAVRVARCAVGGWGVGDRIGGRDAEYRTVVLHRSAIIIAARRATRNVWLKGPSGAGR